MAGAEVEARTGQSLRAKGTAHAMLRDRCTTTHSCRDYTGQDGEVREVLAGNRAGVVKIPKTRE